MAQTAWQSGDGLEGIWPGWRIEAEIGRGSYGTVYRVSREVLGHVSHAAAKRIEVPIDASELTALAAMGMDEAEIDAHLEGLARSIMNEVAVMDSLKGAPNIVSIEDCQLVKREDGFGWTIWIRMELLQDLMTIAARRPLGAAEAARMGVDICRALEACHAAGVIHRDVKPENIFRSAFGGYKLGDFGIAKQMEATRADWSLRGTQRYMAPEVLRGEAYGTSADIYSLGIVLYRLLNGMRFPFVPAAPAAVSAADMEESQLRRFRGETLPAPSEADDELAAIVLRACDADPTRRFATASELRICLDEWLRGHEAAESGAHPAGEGAASLEPTKAYPEPAPEGTLERPQPAESAVSEPRRSKARSLAPLIAVALLAALLAVFFLADPFKLFKPQAAVEVSASSAEAGTGPTPVEASELGDSDLGDADLGDAELGAPMESGYARVLPDGDYVIVLASTLESDPFRYLDIKGVELPAASGTNVKLCEGEGSAADVPACDVWNISYADGFYAIVQKGTDLALDVYDAGLESGTNVQVYAANGTDAQLWGISTNGSGYRIEAKCNGLSLDGADDDACVCASGDGENQRWLLIPVE